MNSLDFFGERFGQGRMLTWFMAFGDLSKIPLMLGWATEHGIPYSEAMAAMASDLPFRQRRRIKLAANDLAGGAALSDVLTTRLSGMTPRYYVAAVKKAEADHCVSDMLPQLAKHVQFIDDLKLRSTSLAAYPATQLFYLLSMLLLVYIFILPHFGSIAEELLAPMALPRLFQGTMAISRRVAGSGGLALFLVCLVAPSGFVLWKIMPGKVRDRIFPLHVLIDRLFQWIPLIGGLLRRIALLEVVGAMAVLTGAGYDMAPAARWNAAVVSSTRLRRKLSAFAASVEQGTYWADAWETFSGGAPGYDWVMRSAAAREAPAEGFAVLASGLYHELRRRAAAVTQWADVIRVLLGAGLVGMSVIAVWQVLFLVVMQTLAMTS